MEKERKNNFHKLGNKGKKINNQGYQHLNPYDKGSQCNPGNDDFHTLLLCFTAHYNTAYTFYIILCNSILFVSPSLPKPDNFNSFLVLGMIISLIRSSILLL